MKLLKFKKVKVGDLFKYKNIILKKTSRNINSKYNSISLCGNKKYKINNEIEIIYFQEIKVICDFFNLKIVIDK